MTEKKILLDENEDYEIDATKCRKKYAILFVRNIIIDNTNYCRAFSAEDISRYLDRFPYSMKLNRKAIYTIIDILRAEYPFIIKNEDGRVWYDPDMKAA